MKKAIFLTLIFSFLLISSSNFHPVQAKTDRDCASICNVLYSVSSVGYTQCINACSQANTADSEDERWRNSLPEDLGGLLPAKSGMADFGVITNPVSGTPDDLINRAIDTLTAFAVIALLIIIIICGINLIVQAKSPEDFSNNVKKILISIAGLILVASAYSIMKFIGYFLFGNPSIGNSVNNFM